MAYRSDRSFNIKRGLLLLREQYFPVHRYALGETLESGQAFRWRRVGEAFEGVIGNRWVRLREEAEGIRAWAVDPGETDWYWLRYYLQLEVKIDEVTSTFPSDQHLSSAVEACRGLRLLRQEPWECLASFILSSTKQIIQIRQIVAALCCQYGEPVLTPGDKSFAFPTAERMDALDEVDLRGCKMGFRAPYLKGTAGMVARGELNLEALHHMDVARARSELMRCPGVGRKIADCVLLFAYGFQQAFPMDVWILKALRQLYFPRRRPSPRRLLHFTETYFGRNAGYAQQYLFHYMRTRHDELLPD